MIVKRCAAFPSLPPVPAPHPQHQVTEDDVRSAYRLWFDALSGSAADEEGRLDMNLLTGDTGGGSQEKGSQERDRGRVVGSIQSHTG